MKALRVDEAITTAAPVTPAPVAPVPVAAPEPPITVVRPLEAGRFAVERMGRVIGYVEYYAPVYVALRIDDWGYAVEAGQSLDAESAVRTVLAADHLRRLG